MTMTCIVPIAVHGWCEMMDNLPPALDVACGDVVFILISKTSACLSATHTLGIVHCVMVVRLMLAQMWYLISESYLSQIKASTSSSLTHRILRLAQDGRSTSTASLILTAGMRTCPKAFASVYVYSNPMASLFLSGTSITFRSRMYWHFVRQSQSSVTDALKPLKRIGCYLCENQRR